MLISGTQRLRIAPLPRPPPKSCGKVGSVTLHCHAAGAVPAIGSFALLSPRITTSLCVSVGEQPKNKTAACCLPWKTGLPPLKFHRPSGKTASLIGPSCKAVPPVASQVMQSTKHLSREFPNRSFCTVPFCVISFVSVFPIRLFALSHLDS
ncbi:hypothetical protein BGZ63DRAFT_204838 [Mariannaea sp. PMI_226]|nr:hypothetical protein BGZ63DRAFT_204838 [Mariannaea sp. PMI_226]